MTAPETRPSLLLRVRNPDDRAAWDEFAEIYRPVICRMARFRGMQHADAEDLAQQVLVAISRAVESWEPDNERAKFRTWLKRVAGNAILNSLTRGVPDRASGTEAAQALLHDRPERSGPDSDLLKTEYRREVFAWAARQIRSEYSDDTWQSFWMSAVEGESVDSVAAKLGRSCGSVYASRSRVMKRLREKVEQFDDQQSDGNE